MYCNIEKTCTATSKKTCTATLKTMYCNISNSSTATICCNNPKIPMQHSKIICCNIKKHIATREKQQKKVQNSPWPTTFELARGRRE
jgi:hypothetical protein